MNSIKASAKHYRDNYGWNVIPIPAGRKSPVVEWKEYQERRVSDDEFEDFDWTGNVGVATGEISGVIVVDIENKPGRNGSKTLDERGWNVSDTVLAKTASGGAHAYFKWPGFRVKNHTGKGEIAPGVEVKGDGGIVVAPPSVVEWREQHDPDTRGNKVRGQYEWINSPDDTEIADCPDWLLEALSKRPERRNEDLSEPIPEGSRNSTLTSLAGTLAARGLPQNVIRETLHTVNIKHTQTPLPADEVDGITIYEPRQLPSDEIGVLLSDVEPESVEWLWYGRIPLGKLTILDGDPGLGKSVITMDLAARVTTGWPFPNGDVDHLGNLDHLDHLGDVGGVVIISAEDGLADTIRPRLDAAGADTSRVVAISTVPDGEGNERTISIPEDITTIARAIQRVNAKLVIVDPLMAFLSGKANYDQDVRKALTPLARMAEGTGVAVLVVRHLNKQQGVKALYRGGSSIGIIGAARSGLVVEEHPDDAGIKVLAMNKANLAEKAPSLTYHITTADNDAAKVVWGTTTELDANDILNPDNSELGKAKAWLADKLSDGPLPAKTVEADADAVGIKDKTLYRAKVALGIKSKKDGPNGSWRWHPEDGQGGQDGQDSQEALMSYADGEMDDDVPFN